MRVMLDTNVLIDYFNKREPFYRDACKLRIMHEFGDIELWASVNSFSDIAYILRNQAGSAELQKAFLTSLDFLQVCSSDQHDLELACKEQWEDFEDCLIEQCAQKTRADYILTRDIKGFDRSTATVLSPTDFIELMSTEFGLTYDTVEI